MTSAIEEVSLSEAKRIARFMGLPRWQDMDDLGLVASVSRGFPVRTATTVAQRIDPESRFLRPSDIIPKSTLHRREKARKQSWPRLFGQNFRLDKWIVCRV